MLTEESTGREDGYDERLLGGVQGPANRGILVSVTECPEPVFHGGYARAGARVVSEKDATEGGESDHGNTDGIALWCRCANAGAGGSGTAWHYVRR